MNSGFLSNYFTGVGTKVLTRVDATPHSNQHEIGDGNRGDVLMRILGNTPRKKNNRFNAKYVWLEDEQQTTSEAGFLSWYDTRESVSHRGPEWRLYYQTNFVTEKMDEGDRLYIARRNDDEVLFIVVPVNSPLSGDVSWLFGLEEAKGEEFEAVEIQGKHDTVLDFISRYVLDLFGIEFEDPNADVLDAIIERFGDSFPTTRVFSGVARQTLAEPADARDEPDTALMAWLNHEEAIFRRLERKIVSDRITGGFVSDDGVDVDGFVSFSLSVQNRRKSRMGYSFQNQLSAVFGAHELRYGEQVTTENNMKPDFIFPGKAEYFDPRFDVTLLTMLGAKSTCKDRWSQILPEAERIPLKHLVTLEPGISETQTETMRNSHVQLVVPAAIQVSYTDRQRGWLYSVADFLILVAERQAQIP